MSTACGVSRARGFRNKSSLLKKRTRAPDTAAACASRANVRSSRAPAVLCSTAFCSAPAQRASAMLGTSGRARRIHTRRGQTPRRICNVEHTLQQGRNQGSTGAVPPPPSKSVVPPVDLVF